MPMQRKQQAKKIPSETNWMIWGCTKPDKPWNMNEVETRNCITGKQQKKKQQNKPYPTKWSPHMILLPLHLTLYQAF